MATLKVEFKSTKNGPPILFLAGDGQDKEKVEGHNRRSDLRNPIAPPQAQGRIEILIGPFTLND